MDYPKYIWRNKKLIDWEQATVHVFSHAVNYSSGIRGVRKEPDYF